MKTRLNQRGVSPLILMGAVLVLAAIGVIGYRLTQQDDPAGSSTTSRSTPADGYKSAADLDKASTELDSTDLDSEVNPDQLDEDISQL